MAVQSCVFFHNLFVGYVNFTYHKCLNYYVVDYLCVFLLFNLRLCADHTPLLLQIAKQHAEELAAQKKSLKKKRSLKSK